MQEHVSRNLNLSPILLGQVLSLFDTASAFSVKLFAARHHFQFPILQYVIVYACVCLTTVVALKLKPYTCLWIKSTFFLSRSAPAPQAFPALEIIHISSPHKRIKQTHFTGSINAPLNRSRSVGSRSRTQFPQRALSSTRNQSQIIFSHLIFPDDDIATSETDSDHTLSQGRNSLTIPSQRRYAESPSNISHDSPYSISGVTKHAHPRKVIKSLSFSEAQPSTKGLLPNKKNYTNNPFADLDVVNQIALGFSPIGPQENNPYFNDKWIIVASQPSFCQILIESFQVSQPAYKISSNSIQDSDVDHIEIQMPWGHHQDSSQQSKPLVSNTEVLLPSGVSQQKNVFSRLFQPWSLSQTEQGDKFSVSSFGTKAERFCPGSFGFYFILALMDVHGGTLTTLSFGYTNLANSCLIDYVSLLTSYVISVKFLQEKITRNKLLALILGLLGSLFILGSDAYGAQIEAKQSEAAYWLNQEVMSSPPQVFSIPTLAFIPGYLSPHNLTHLEDKTIDYPQSARKVSRFWGDFFGVLAAFSMGISSVMIEKLVTSGVPIHDILLKSCSLSVLIATAEFCLMEFKDIHLLRTLTATGVAYFLSTAVFMAIATILAPFVIRASSSSFYNLSLLTSTVLLVLLSAVVLGDDFPALYSVGLIVILSSILIYYQ